jgi:uncharacterized membrane protein YdfJ with MMPL/SSD domain
MRFLKRFRYLILVIWLLIAIMGLLFGLKFLKTTKSTFDAPVGSDSYKAAQALDEAFPGSSEQVISKFQAVFSPALDWVL